MKYRIRHYAQILAEMIKQPAGSLKERRMAGDFVALLASRGDLHNVREIMALADKFFIEKKGGRIVVVETARSLKKKPWVSVFREPGTRIVEKINPELVAGIRITVNGRQLDMSLSRKLRILFTPRADVA